MQCPATPPPPQPSTASAKLLRLTLIGLGAVSAFVAVNVAFGGLETLGLQGPTDYVQVTDRDAYLLRDSHAHFYGGVYLGIAIFLIVASTNLRKYRTGLNVVFAVIFLGGRRPAHPTRAGRHVRQRPRRLQPHRTRRHAGDGALARRRHPDAAQRRRHHPTRRSTRLTHPSPRPPTTRRKGPSHEQHPVHPRRHRDPPPRRQVWAVVTDYATDTVWRKGITEMTPDRDGPPHVGTNVREVLQLGGRQYVTDTTVTEVGPGMSYRFAGTGTSGVVRGRRNVTPAATPDTAVFTYDVELEPTPSPASSAHSCAGGSNTACAATCAASAPSSPPPPETAKHPHPTVVVAFTTRPPCRVAARGSDHLGATTLTNCLHRPRPGALHAVDASIVYRRQTTGRRFRSSRRHRPVARLDLCCASASSKPFATSVTILARSVSSCDVQPAKCRADRPIGRGEMLNLGPVKASPMCREMMRPLPVSCRRRRRLRRTRRGGRSSLDGGHRWLSCGDRRDERRSAHRVEGLPRRGPP